MFYLQNFAEMRYFATYWLDHQPEVTGRTTGTTDRYESFHETTLASCHEFTVANVDVDKSLKVDYCTFAANVTLIAGKFPETSLHGPASLLKDRTLIYPCTEFQCRLGCPCHLCRKKVNICSKAGKKATCDGDCSDCRSDCYEHMLFHRALHLECKFCWNLLDHIPHPSFVIRKVRGYYPEFHEERLSASLFKHCYNDVKPTQEQPSNKFACDKCDGTFVRKRDLKRHEISVHYGKRYECHRCAMKFTRKDSMDEHERNVHFREEGLQHQCDICKVTFKKKANLVQHSKVSSVCEVCFAVFCTTKQLQFHKRNSHNVQHSCDSCKKSFSEKGNLKRHVEGRHRADGSWKIFCEKCSSDFCSLQDLLKHDKIHPKKCTYCDKTFTTNRNLSVHLANREDILCSKCGIVLCNISELRVHNNAVHNIKQCNLCGKIYDLENYKYHMYAEHQQLVESE